MEADAKTVVVNLTQKTQDTQKPSVKRQEYPLEYCHFCERNTQRRDNAANCFWCKNPFGTQPAPVEVIIPPITHLQLCWLVQVWRRHAPSLVSVSNEVAVNEWLTSHLHQAYKKEEKDVLGQ